MPRELIDTGTDKRYVRRDSEGRFSESTDVGKSHAQDQKRDAKNVFTDLWTTTIDPADQFIDRSKPTPPAPAKVH